MIRIFVVVLPSFITPFFVQRVVFEMEYDESRPASKKRKTNHTAGDETASGVLGNTDAAALSTRRGKKVSTPAKRKTSMRASTTAKSPARDPDLQNIKHGLSDEEVANIMTLIRADLMERIDAMKGEYHPNMTKGFLRKALFEAHAAKNKNNFVTSMDTAPIDSVTVTQGTINQVAPTVDEEMVRRRFRF